MAYVRVEQRNAHLAGSVQLSYVDGREGKVAKAVLTAISNARRGSGETREDEPTAIQWTLWSKQAENAAEYLGKGSHVNVVGRLRIRKYEKDGKTAYGTSFIAEEIDYLDSKAEADARRAKGEDGADGEDGANAAEPKPQAKAAAGKGSKPRKPARPEAAAAADDDVPF